MFLNLSKLKVWFIFLILNNESIFLNKKYQLKLWNMNCFFNIQYPISVQKSITGRHIRQPNEISKIKRFIKKKLPQEKELIFFTLSANIYWKKMLLNSFKFNSVTFTLICWHLRFKKKMFRSVAKTGNGKRSRAENRKI